MRPCRSAAPALTRAAAGAAALALVTSTLGAQEVSPGTADSVGPRAGTWATEASVGQGGFGAALLRFRSPTSAWVLALNASAGTVEREFSPVDEESESSYDVTAQLGLRGYSHRDAVTADGRGVRPTFGGGVFGGAARPQPGIRTWTAGLYGELGVTYFFSPHVSLGGMGALIGSYRELNYDGSEFGGSDAEERRATVSFGLARLVGTVYF